MCVLMQEMFICFGNMCKNKDVLLMSANTYCFCLYEKVKLVLVLAEGEGPRFIEKITLNGHLLCSFSNK